jgi:uncharacterized protein (TIGR03067 family)
MRRVVPLLIVLSLGFAPAPVYRGKPGPAKDDLARMQGVWVVESFIGDGVRMPATQENVWTMTGNRVTTTFSGMPSTEFTLELGDGGVPRPADWVIGKERMPGRYRLDGGRLEVGIGPEGKRPPDLSGKGAGVGVWILKRKAP